MFYDFNNFSKAAQDNNQTSLNGDRVPSRNFRSRGRVGLTSKDQQRQTTPYINNMKIANNGPFQVYIAGMEAIREEETIL